MKIEVKRNYLADTDWFDYQFICGFLNANRVCVLHVLCINDSSIKRID
jgi:hypothetical protein